MKIRFIKQHPAGIPEGSMRVVGASFGNRMIESGFAVEETGEETIIPEQIAVAGQTVKGAPKERGAKKKTK